MKKLFLLLFLLPFAATASPNKQKTEKAAIEAKAFQAICELVNNKHFQIDIDRAYPQSGFDVSLFRPQGKIIVTDSIAKGNLPYFGRAYSLPYGEGGSIEFEGKIKQKKITITQKRKKKSITFAFSVPGKRDHFQITIEAMSNGKCSIHLHSNNQSQISYSGNISSIKKQE